MSRLIYLHLIKLVKMKKKCCIQGHTCTLFHSLLKFPQSSLNMYHLYIIIGRTIILLLNLYFMSIYNRNTDSLKIRWTSHIIAAISHIVFFLTGLHLQDFIFLWAKYYICLLAIFKKSVNLTLITLLLHNSTLLIFC